MIRNVRINRVVWLDKSNPEAEVWFEIEKTILVAYCHPCDFVEGELVSVEFDFIEEDISEDVFWSENSGNKKEVVKSSHNNLRYYCYGQINGVLPTTIDCGIMTFSFGNWINDERSCGSYVYFVISRLDIQRYYL